MAGVGNGGVAINSYRDLDVWQASMDLAAEAYRLAELLPRKEVFRLTSQLARAAASVPSNIAEGNARGTGRDYAHFVSIARGSLAEVETLLMLAKRTRMRHAEEVRTAMALSDRIGRQLNVLRKRLEEPRAPSKSP